MAKGIICPFCKRRGASFIRRVYWVGDSIRRVRRCGKGDRARMLIPGSGCGERFVTIERVMCAPVEESSEAAEGSEITPSA